MRGKILSLAGAAALLASVGAANAKGPVELSDVQLDKVTAGDSQVGEVVLGAAEDVQRGVLIFLLFGPVPVPADLQIALANSFSNLDTNIQGFLTQLPATP